MQGSGIRRLGAKSNSLSGLAFVIAAAALLAVLGQRFIGGGEADASLTPAGGAPATLEEALALASDSGKPVIAIATASWCPPCRSYKGDALSDPEVVAVLNDEAITVMVDVDQSPDDAGALGVRSIPATYVITDGTIVAERIGPIPANEVISLVRSATPAD